MQLRGKTSLAFLLLMALVVPSVAPAQSNGIDPSLLAKAQAGDANAEFLVGHAYARGEGVSQDHTQAAIWYRRAAEQGYALAQSYLCAEYVDGVGVPHDFAQAAFWCRKAADQGNDFAQFDMGSFYEQGKGVPQDYALAASWYLKSANQYNHDAQYNLGRLYHEGLGVAKDMSESYFWLSLAATGKLDEERKKGREIVAAQLTKEQISEEQERFVAWFAAHPLETAKADGTNDDIQKSAMNLPEPVSTQAAASQATNSTKDEWMKAGVDQIRTMVQTIKNCPASVYRSATSTLTDGPPYNVTWDVSASQSVRAPYAGYIELTVPSIVRCSAAQRQQSQMGCDIVERPKFPLVLRYEYDLSPDGLSLSKILVRRDNETEWSNRPNVSNYCWERAAQPIGVVK
jgi:TPR repeat protein